VRYNNVTDNLKLMADGAGIYTLSKQPGTLIAENYVHDIVRTSVQGSYIMAGIYLDEGSNLITVRDNVIQNTGESAVFQNGVGPSNTFSNNGGSSPSVIANSGLEPAYQNIRPGGGGTNPPAPAAPSNVRIIR
jgi:hypothetical protein